MVGGKSKAASPVRQSPRKSSNPNSNPSSIPSTSYHHNNNNSNIPQHHLHQNQRHAQPINNHQLHTPVSISPTLSSSTHLHRFPPPFDSLPPINSQFPQYFTPRSPYRPGEYGRRSVGQHQHAVSERSAGLAALAGGGGGEVGAAGQVGGGGPTGTGMGMELNPLKNIERRLFDDDLMLGNGLNGSGGEDEDEPKRNRGSSPLQPAFEARLILRKGAPVDLISWLRRNFHHIPSPSHPSLTSSTSLLAIRALLAERFPRVPENDELVKAVEAAFPRVQMDFGHPATGEPPMVRGLVWNGKETEYEDPPRDRERAREKEREEKRRMNLDIAMNGGNSYQNYQTPERKISTKYSNRKIDETRGTYRQHLPTLSGTTLNNSTTSGGYGTTTTTTNGGNNNDTSLVSRSPTQSTLVSPTSSTRKALPQTPARSVLEEFAELATLADKTPVSKTTSLPDHDDDDNGNAGEGTGRGRKSSKKIKEKGRKGGEGEGEGKEDVIGRLPLITPAPAYKLVNIINSFDEPPIRTHKRRLSMTASENNESGSGSGSGLNGLLAAAETIEGSPINEKERIPLHQASAHKRRRTIGGSGMREIMRPEISGIKFDRKKFLARGTMSPALITGWIPENPGHEQVEMEDESRMKNGESSKRKTEGILPSIHEPQQQQQQHQLPHQQQPYQTPNGDFQNYDLTQLTPSSLISTPLPPPPLPPLPPPSSLHPAPSTSSSVNTGGSGNGKGRNRKANELPTEGQYPGFDCKPPHPYHEMIRHAIENAPDQRLQLSQIYSSIADRFPFFKTLDDKKTSGWQNSIRHNLSLKKMFIRVNKVDGIPDDGGKGGWWTVQPGIPDEGRPGRKSKHSTSVNGLNSASTSKRGSFSETSSLPGGGSESRNRTMKGMSYMNRGEEKNQEHVDGHGHDESGERDGQVWGKGQDGMGLGLGLEQEYPTFSQETTTR